MNKRLVGSNYEQAAVKYLTDKGYSVITCNYRTRYGEIDIIGKDGEYLCFIEVKYRKSLRYGYPEDAVDYRKQNKIKQVANFYMFSNRYYNIKCRFDVVAICNTDIKLYKNAF